MIGRAKQAVRNGSRNGYGTGRPVKLSATMVDLSMQHDRADSLNLVPPAIPTTTEFSSPKANVQFINSTAAAIPEEKVEKAAPVDPGFVEASRKVSRISIPRIIVLVLALLVFAVLLVARSHRTDSVRRQSTTPTTVQQRDSPLVPVRTGASKSTHNHAHAVGPKKANSRGRRDDYVAKDTYVYYGKEGKPNH